MKSHGVDTLRWSFGIRISCLAAKSPYYSFMRFFSLLACLWLVAGAAFAADAVPAPLYFPVLPLGASKEAVPQWVPLASTMRLDGAHAGVVRAIVVLHDETRDATAAMTAMAALAGEQNASTIIVAPQFLVPSDIVRFADLLPGRGRAFAAWQVSGWSKGDDSMPVSGRRNVSSFAVVDLLLMILSDKNLFPDLSAVVVAGYGAGANFVQRYAAFNSADDVLEKQNIGVRYVVAGAGNFLYLTPSRFLGGRKGFGAPEAPDCPAYNAYPYGLERMNDYARRRGANAAKVDYTSRLITYISAKGPDPFPETDCAALMQGLTSTERAERYRLYLQSVYGDHAARTQAFAAAKEDKNDAAALFGSPCGITALFGDGACPASYGRIQ